MKTLGPVLADLHAATLHGVRAPRRDYASTSHIHRKTTNRSIMRDQIVHELRGRIDGRADVRVVDYNQTTYFFFGEEFQMLVKMSDEHGEVALNDNQRSFDFQCNKVPDLFDFEMTNVYLSYVDNLADPDNPAVLVICPNA